MKDLGQVGGRPPIPTRFIFKLNKCHRCSISRIFNYDLNLKSIAVVLITTAMREYLQESKIVKYLLYVSVPRNTAHTYRLHDIGAWVSYKIFIFGPLSQYILLILTQRYFHNITKHTKTLMSE